MRLAIANATPVPTSPPLLKPPKSFPVPEGFPFNGWTREQKQVADELRAHVEGLLEEVTGSAVLVGTPLSGEREWALREECVARYCRAAKFEVGKAKQMMEKTLNWRREFRPTEIKPAEVEEEAKNGKMYWSGHDREGRPILHFNGAIMISSDVDRFLKFVVFLLEKGTQLCPYGQFQFAAVVDAKNVGLWTVNSPTVYVKCLDIISSHFPESLGLCLMINPSWYLHVIWKIVSPFVDPVTRSKVCFADTRQQQPQRVKQSVKRDQHHGTGGWVNGMDEFVAMEQVPVGLGGRFEFEYFHEACWWPFLEVVGA
ncbi:hypothetical protein HDU98_010591 [Podochytrium sp. JEL0797]|nr:hypothetical protein HDU98_010591 [Podochytrium sp. JEL0797]